MKIGIDIDGTITINPSFFNKLISSAFRAGDEIHIITGGLEEGKGYEFNSRKRIKQLNEMDIYGWTKLVRCFASTTEEVADLKGRYCLENKIDCLYEDTLSYIEAVKRISPFTQTFLIK